MCVCVTSQSSDVSDCTVTVASGCDDLTGLSAVPSHYQMLSELGGNPSLQSPQHMSLAGAIQTGSLSQYTRYHLCLLVVSLVFFGMSAGKGFNNMSQVSMARHTPSGQLVALKHTDLDECTEDELLQLMVSF